MNTLGSLCLQTAISFVLFVFFSDIGVANQNFFKFDANGKVFQTTNQSPQFLAETDILKRYHDSAPGWEPGPIYPYGELNISSVENLGRLIERSISVGDFWTIFLIFDLFPEMGVDLGTHVSALIELEKMDQTITNYKNLGLDIPRSLRRVQLSLNTCQVLLGPRTLN